MKIIIFTENNRGGGMDTFIASLIKNWPNKDDFIVSVKSGYLTKNKIDNIFHLGACSSTTEWDGKFLMNNNYEYSKVLL